MIKFINILFKIIVITYFLYFIYANIYVSYETSVSSENIAHSKKLGLFKSEVKYKSLSKNIAFENYIKRNNEVYLEYYAPSNILSELIKTKPKKTKDLKFRFIPKYEEEESLNFVTKYDSTLHFLHYIYDTSLILNKVGYFYNCKYPTQILDSGYFYINYSNFKN